MPCNTTLEDAEVSTIDLSIGITFHHLGLLIAASCGLIAIIIASYLILQHALHYRVPAEQKHIIRILFMIPVYAAVSFLSYLDYKRAIYYEVLRDCYEAFAIASFFTLLCNYCSPTLHDQKEYFRTLKPVNWILPINWIQKCTGGQDRGPFRKPSSGLTWFNLIYACVFQYCFVRVLFTIVSVGSQTVGRYCEASLSPAYAHIWVLVFEASSVTIAMYALIQFYIQLKGDLASKRPFLKLLCIKLVIFFSFWQTLVISFASSANGPLQPTDVLAYPDIKVGIPSMLLCVEMAIFAVLHLFAFPWKIYAHNADPKGWASVNGSGATPQSGPASYLGGFLGWKAFVEVFNPWDIMKATARGFKWLFVGRRTRKADISYQTGADHGGWGGAGAFEEPESHVSHAPVPTHLQEFDRLAPQYPPATRYQGPHQGRQGLSRTASADDDDTWAMHVAPEDDVYPQRPSFESGAEDRAGLLRNPAQTGRTGVSVSPARRDPEEGRRHENYEFNKEIGIEEQYTGYGRHSWGKDQRHM